ncbi:MAG: ABC transporter permease [Deltaproteobacteria bacterium]|nr:ABC transporter permease [Deltaproteobacteria bacterium]
MTALLKKEFRGTLGYFLLLLFLAAVSTIHEILTSPIDQWSAQRLIKEMGTANAFVTAILTLPLAHRLLAAESDNKTIEFLDALPVTRTRVFFSKFIVANVVMSVPSWLQYAWTFMLGSISRTSLQSGAYIDIITQDILRDFVFTFFVLGLAFLFSYFRGYGWFFFPLLFGAIKWVEPWVPHLSLILPETVFEKRFEGEQMLLPYRSLAACAAVALGAYVLSWRLFCGRGGELLAQTRALSQRWPTRILFVVGIVVAVVGGSFMAARDKMTEEGKRTDDSVGGVDFEDFHLTEARTRYYVIHYPASLRETGRLLVGRADEAHEFIRERLRVAPSSDPIQVDGTAPLAHAGRAGQTVGASIGLDLKASHDPLLVLAHETAHFYAEELAHRRLAAKPNSTRFFHEGIAQYLGFAFVGDSDAIERAGIEAAWLDRFQATKLDAVMDADTYIQKYGEEGLYTVGLIFVESLIELEGSDALPAVIEAFGREGAPNNLAGEALFRDAFQAAHLSYDAVVSRTRVKIASFADHHEHLLDALPSLSGSLDADDDFVRLRPDGIEASDAVAAEDLTFHRGGYRFRVVARFRSGAQSRSETYSGRLQGGEFWIPRAMFPSNTVSFQLGFVADREREREREGEGEREHRLTLWSPWTRLSL